MKISNAELKLIDWCVGRSGSFVESLFNCMSKCDEANLCRMGEGFPEEVKVFKRFRYEKDYWKNLLTQYNTERKAHDKTE